MKPIILITPSLADEEKFIRISRAYTNAVENAGGIALIPDYACKENIPRLLGIADGVLLSGGGDIDPVLYGEAPVREIGEISPLRDEYEITLTKYAVENSMPILAICRGAQVLNAALGGKVYQDIYSAIKTPLIKHSQEMPRKYASHSANVEENTLLMRIIGSGKIRVNSFHHQAVSVLGRGLKASAAAEDGVIEAIEHEGLKFCLGVQWHPEHMIDVREHFDIFKEFIEAAR